MVVESDSALVSGLRSVVSDSALSVLPVASVEFPAVFLGKIAIDAVGLGVGPPCFRVDSEEALLRRTDERALLARAATGATPEMKLVTKSWMAGRQETTNGMGSMNYVRQLTASVWMPFKQTCDEESDDADFDSFKTAPWDAGGTQRDKLLEVMCRTMVHNVDRWTTRNTECELATKMLMNTSCPRLTMTPGEDDASYGGTQIGGELHDTLDISDGHTRRKDDDILRHSAVCIEIDIPADMNCTAVELNDVTILRRRLPQGQDSAEHYECYISHTRRKDDDILRHSAVCVEIDVPVDMNCTTAPWDASSTQNDKLHEAMCRAMVHKGDRSTTRNTKCEPTTKMLVDTNCPRLKMTPGEGDSCYGGTQIGGELQDTLAISDGHTRRKHDNILRRMC